MRKTLIVITTTLFLIVLNSPLYAWSDGDTATAHPIILVPGVMGFDTLLGMVDYFYGVEDAIEEYSQGQQVINISISSWMGTEKRGAYLAEAIEDLYDEYGWDESKKVNIIAHSHGSTTSRVAMKLLAEKAEMEGNPNPVASLTTIAGPHYGTPFADYAASLPKWLIKIVAMGLDLAGETIALFSGHCEWLNKQNSEDVLNDFTQQGIEQFNQKYSCAGVPPGGSYGEGSYGEDVTGVGAVAGDGFGNELEASDPDAIKYYSFTGNIGDSHFTNGLDPADVVLWVIHLFNNWQGYHGDADAFIPVSSAQFGDVICDSYYWNHVDEQNQILGLLDANAADPLEVYRNHANRLKTAGL